MKKMFIATAIGLFIALVLVSMPVNGENIGYTDPVGDVENEGMDTSDLPDIDITKLMVTVSADTVVIELTVDGTIIYDQEGFPYHQYRFMFDLDGDLEQDVFIDLDTFSDTYTIDTDAGVFESIEDKLAGNGTSKLTVTLPLTWFGDMSSYDVEAEAQTGDLMDYADDEVNDGFEGGTPIGDDDDAVDDDTTDDDTTDDDTADDDTTDDDDDDSPGFGLIAILSGFAVLVGIALIYRRRQH
ncbi:MAG: Heimdall-CTERM domain-containing surface protein [Thermoplasmatota archaeon]